MGDPGLLHLFLFGVHSCSAPSFSTRVTSNDCLVSIPLLTAQGTQNPNSSFCFTTFLWGGWKGLSLERKVGDTQ